MAELVFFRRSEELMRVNLEGRRLTLGRASTNDIVVPDSTVSRQHLAIECRGDRWILTDLSGNRIDLAGAPVSEAELADGCDIGLGQWRAVFHLASSASFGEEATGRAHRGDTVVQPRICEEALPVPAKLRVVSSEGERLIPFQREATVGTAESCVVRLADPFVSATHAAIERRENSFRVRDLCSRNGTFVGSVRIVEAEVPFGCPIHVGNAELTLVRAGGGKGAAMFEGMVGSDPPMRRVYETIDRVAPSQAAVAIFGESGTGKELVARAIHARSPRAAKPFVPVNCGALSKELVESELFGHEKGAFTGAERLRRGAFEEADSGTLFLDEIGELPLALQGKLLRALELGEIKRVGATRPMNVDVRIVAATNRDLRSDVKQGAFREDLYWRLCVVPMQLPPLRARRSDLRALAAHFLKIYAPHGTAVSLSPEAERRLLEHDWPGNVRELKNTLHRSMLLRRGERIEASDIAFDRDLNLASRAAEGSGPYDPDADDSCRVYIVDKSLERIEDEVFLKTCRRLGTRASALARALGQSRGAAYRRMEKLGITPCGSEPREED
jgi:DNA-binding NtrC family response regulator/pSer/pThr/pTyr-binding forkhead associated (FHA) protein